MTTQAPRPLPGHVVRLLRLYLGTLELEGQSRSLVLDHPVPALHSALGTVEAIVQAALSRAGYAPEFNGDYSHASATRWAEGLLASHGH